MHTYGKKTRNTCSELFDSRPPPSRACSETGRGGEIIVTTVTTVTIVASAGGPPAPTDRSAARLRRPRPRARDDQRASATTTDDRPGGGAVRISGASAPRSETRLSFRSATESDRFFRRSSVFGGGSGLSLQTATVPKAFFWKLVETTTGSSVPVRRQPRRGLEHDPPVRCLFAYRRGPMSVRSRAPGAVPITHRVSIVARRALVRCSACPGLRADVVAGGQTQMSTLGAMVSEQGRHATVRGVNLCLRHRLQEAESPIRIVERHDRLPPSSASPHRRPAGTF